MSTYDSYFHLSKSKDDTENIQADKLYQILHFEVDCGRTRTDIGTPYGDTKAAMLTVTIKDVVCIDELYKRMKEQEPFNYHIFSSTTVKDGNFNAKLILRVTGYVVDIIEDFIYSPHNPDIKDSETNESSATIKILIASLSYKYYNDGTEKTLVITE